MDVRLGVLNQLVDFFLTDTQYVSNQVLSCNEGFDCNLDEQEKIWIDGMG